MEGFFRVTLKGVVESSLMRAQKLNRGKAMNVLSQLQDLLRDLFQLDLADLDFGLYRLLRLKRDEVEAMG